MDYNIKNKRLEIGNYFKSIFFREGGRIAA